MNCLIFEQNQDALISAPSPHPEPPARESCRQTPEDPATATAAPNSVGPALAGGMRFFRPLPRDLSSVVELLRAAGWVIVFVSDSVSEDGRHRITAREPLHGVALELAVAAEEVALSGIACYFDDDSMHTAPKGTPP